MRAVIAHSGPARRRRPLGQAVLEVALALPVLLLLLAGGSQVGAIAYGMVSIDTAAREAGMVGQDSPKSSLDGVVAAGGTYTCTSSNRNVETNPICIAAYQSVGLLDKTKMTVKITVRGSSLLSLYHPPLDVVEISSNGCSGSQAQVSGSVTGLPSGQEATVSSSTDGAGTRTSSQSYTLCTGSGSNATISATATVGSCTYSGTSSPQTFKNNKTYSGVNIAVSASCTTTSTTTTTTTSTTSSSSTSTVSQSTTTASTFSCDQSVTYPGYFTVTVSYPVNVFVPLVGGIFADSGKSYRTVSSAVDEEIAPCGVTNGQ